jgi:hypothetical protein
VAVERPPKQASKPERPGEQDGRIFVCSSIRVPTVTMLPDIQPSKRLCFTPRRYRCNTFFEKIFQDVNWGVFPSLENPLCKLLTLCLAVLPCGCKAWQRRFRHARNDKLIKQLKIMIASKFALVTVTVALSAAALLSSIPKTAKADEIIPDTALVLQAKIAGSTTVSYATNGGVVTPKGGVQDLSESAIHATGVRTRHEFRHRKCARHFGAQRYGHKL